MKSLMLIGLLLLPCFVSAESYSLVRVPLSGPRAVDRLIRLGLALEEGANWAHGGVEMIAGDAEIARLRNAGFQVVMMHPDMSAYYRARLQPYLRDSFASGKMGGFYTFSEVLQKMTIYRQKYKSLVSAPVKIGTSAEGRPILAYKISDQVDTDETDEPEVLYTALHHAREPESLMCVMYFIDQLLTGYGKDPEITYIVDHRQLWFVPVVNPDGYVFNELNSPGGGGMWRKNRRNNGDGSYGVDLNRNYGYAWGIDDVGSSATTGEETYRGPSAFSEPEIMAIRDFVASHRFSNAMNFHSYRNALIYPWSYQNAFTPQQAIFSELSTYLVRVSHYVTGTTYGILRYVANGDADDWLYAGLAGKRVFGMTLEVGNYGDGFWPSTARIRALAIQNYASNLSTAWMAGGYPVVNSWTFENDSGATQSVIRPGGTYRLALTLRNLGIKQAVPKLSVRLVSPTTAAAVQQQNSNYGTLKPFRSSIRRDLVFQVSRSAVNRKIPLTLWIYSGETLLRKETVTLTTAGTSS